MGHYRLADNLPSAIILAKNPRSGSSDELKSYKDNQIFLNNGTEFQIKLFNPLQEKVGARISMNGKVSNHILVLNPGEDVVVDRFIDEQKRMKFDTYEYDSGNSLAVNAIQKNGDIEISFFKEYQESTVTITSGTYYYYDNPIYTTNGIPLDSSNLTGTLNINGTTGTSNVFLGQSAGLPSEDYATLNNVAGMGNVTLGVFDNEFVSPDISYKETDQSSVESPTRSRSAKSKKLTKSLKKETGRIEKGEKSDQDFEKVELNFNTISFHTIRYKLKPLSEKPTTITEIREYCVGCGYRIRNKSWSYCPKCGGKV
jgi:hypothetical protein